MAQRTPRGMNSEPLVSLFDHHVTGEDLEDTHEPPDWEDRWWCTISQYWDPLSLEKGR